MSELYFAPTDNARPITLQQLQQRLAGAGLRCSVEEETTDMYWILFGPHESTLCVSIVDNQVTLATLDLAIEDSSSVLETIESVMQDIDFSAEDEDY